MKNAKIWRIILGIFLISCLSVSCGEIPENTAQGNKLEKLSVNDISINYTDYYLISYTVQPASLQDEVTVRYSLSKSGRCGLYRTF